MHLTEGFAFLGFNVRRYRNGKLLKPSPAAIKRLRTRLADEMRALRGSNAAAVIAALTPIIRGWAAYYRGVVSSKVFNQLDNYEWKLWPDSRRSRIHTNVTCSDSTGTRSRSTACQPNGVQVNCISDR